MVNKKVKPLSGKDYKKFMGSLYNRLKPLLEKNNVDIKESIFELKKQIEEYDPKLFKFTSYAAKLYESFFTIAVSIVPAHISKSNDILNSINKSYNTKHKNIGKIGKAISIGVSGSKNISANSVIGAVYIPNEIFKLSSLCLNLSNRLKKLAPVVKDIIKSKTLDDLDIDLDKSYISDWSVLASLLALQDTVLLIGLKQNNPKKAKEFIKTYKILGKQLIVYVKQTYKALSEQLKILEKTKADISKKMNINNESFSYLDEGVKTIIKSVLGLLLKPVIKAVSWMFDQSYYFFKRVQPILIYVQNKYTKIISGISSYIFKPLYKINPMFASVVESFVSPIVVPALVRISGFFFGGIPAVFVSNISVTMAIISKILALSTFDMSIAKSIDSGVKFVKDYMNAFAKIGEEMERELSSLEEDLESIEI